MNNHRKPRYQTLTILLALVCIAYIASLFLTYGFIVMPGLAGIDDRAFVAAFQGLETRFQNPDIIEGYQSYSYGNIPALIAFPGAILLSIAAIIANRKRSYLKWIIAALFIFIIGMITTVLYNLPSNIAIFAAGDPNLIDVTKVRTEFNEQAWAKWNHFRAFTSSLSFLCLGRALYLRFESDKEAILAIKN